MGFDCPGYLPVAVAILQGCKRSPALRESEDPKGATAKKAAQPTDIRGEREESYTYETEPGEESSWTLLWSNPRPAMQRVSGRRSKDAPTEKALEETKELLRLSQARDNHTRSGNSGNKVHKERKRKEGRGMQARDAEKPKRLQKEQGMN